MGYHSRATVHEFRAMASTILNEMGFRSDVIERQLAHEERDSVRAAYNRAEYLAERPVMMICWADWIEAGGKVSVRPSEEIVSTGTGDSLLGPTSAIICYSEPRRPHRLTVEKQKTLSASCSKLHRSRSAPIFRGSELRAAVLFFDERGDLGRT
jgi:hypothetical protein